VLALAAGTVISAYFAVLAGERAAGWAEESARANQKADEADRESKRANTKADEADRESKRAYHRAYVSDIRLLQRACEENNLTFARDLLVNTRPENTGGDDYRCFEWYYWNRLEPLRVLKAHTNQVTAMTYSPDGKRLASASQDGSVKVWNAVTGQEIFTAKVDVPYASGLTFTPQGKRLAAAVHTVLHVWDVDTGKELHKLLIPNANVDTVAFSPDGSRLASGGQTFAGEGEIKVWDTDAGRELFTVKGYAASFANLALSPDGKWLASGSFDLASDSPERTITVWNATTGRVARTLRGHTGLWVMVAFSPDGKELVSSGEDTILRIWDIATGQKRLHIEAPRPSARKLHRVRFSSDGKQLIDVFADARAIWDASNGAPISFAQAKGHEIEACSPDGMRLVTSTDGLHSAGSVLTVWDAGALEGSRTLFASDGGQIGSFFVAFSPDGKMLLTEGESTKLKLVIDPEEPGEKGELIAEEPSGKGELIIWDVASGHEMRTFKGHADRVVRAQFSSDGKRIVSCSRDKTLKIWDVDTGREIRTLRNDAAPFNHVAFSPSGTSVVSSSWDALQVWDVASGEARSLLKGRDGLAATYSPNDKWVAAGMDGMIKLVDAETGQSIRVLQRDWGITYAVTFSPDSRRVAASTQKSHLKIWHTDTGEELCALRGHAGAALSLAFSPDGKRLLSGGTDGTVKLWDTQSGQEVLSLKANGHSVSGVAISPDGTPLAAAAGSVTIWKIPK
jgi:WD40 repeat protein